MVAFTARDRVLAPGSMKISGKESVMVDTGQVSQAAGRPREALCVS
ncbi:hypothetical protein ABIA35_007542 [Catenulispora sp. MAP12-49]